LRAGLTWHSTGDDLRLPGHPPRWHQPGSGWFGHRARLRVRRSSRRACPAVCAATKRYRQQPGECLVSFM